MRCWATARRERAAPGQGVLGSPWTSPQSRVGAGLVPAATVLWVCTAPWTRCCTSLGDHAGGSICTSSSSFGDSLLATSSPSCCAIHRSSPPKRSPRAARAWTGLRAPAANKDSAEPLEQLLRRENAFLFAWPVAVTQLLHPRCIHQGCVSSSKHKTRGCGSQASE